MAARSRRRHCAGWLAVAALLSGSFTGCESLSPTQLWKLNRQPRIDMDDSYFSVPNGEIDSAAMEPEAAVLPQDTAGNR
jgi:hypothetical protein